MKTITVDKIATSMQEKVRTFVSILQEVSKADNDSLTMFGSVLNNTFDKSYDVARSVLVADKTDLQMLRNLAPKGVRLGRLCIAAPLIMTQEYIKGSLDTFTLELLEIHQHHNTVFGEDHFVDLTFEDEHIRLQCERELKAALIGMRHGLLASTGQKKSLKAMELDVGQSITRTIRGLAWLKGDRQYHSIDHVIEFVETQYNLQLHGIKNAMHQAGEHGWREFEILYANIEALGKIANDL